MFLEFGQKCFVKLAENYLQGSKDPKSAENITTAMLNHKENGYIFYLRAKARYLQNNFIGALFDIDCCKNISTDFCPELVILEK